MQFIDLKSQYELIRTSVESRIQGVLDHGQYILGPEVKELEGRLAQFAGVKHCISCASGTDALLMALMALGVKTGDEVVVPAFSFFATVEVVLLLGARPVFVDVELASANIDAEALEGVISDQTKAIIAVGLYGQPPAMHRISAIAARYGIPVIEDAAQSFGALYDGRRSCGLGALGCTSFFPSKPLGCYGDGGACFTDQDEIAQALREIRIHGQSKRYTHTRLGINGRLDTLQAAILLAKLEVFEAELKERLRVATIYDTALARLSPNLRLFTPSPSVVSAYGQYTVATPEREALAAYLAERSIPTAIHYPLALHQQPLLAGCKSKRLANAEKLAAEVLSLPFSPYLSESDQSLVIQAMEAFHGH